MIEGVHIASANAHVSHRMAAMIQTPTGTMDSDIGMEMSRNMTAPHVSLASVDLELRQPQPHWDVREFIQHEQRP
jgi:hypothetical protein